MIVWVLVVVLMFSPNGPRTKAYLDLDSCLADRENIVQHLSEGAQDSFAFSEPPYGAVSKCTPVEVKKVIRHA